MGTGQRRQSPPGDNHTGSKWTIGKNMVIFQSKGEEDVAL